MAFCQTTKSLHDLILSKGPPSLLEVPAPWPLLGIWRSGWDSNPRGLAPYTLSRRACSTTPAPLRDLTAGTSFARKADGEARTRSRRTYRRRLAERAGFEPAVPCEYTAFRERRLKPLGHLSSRHARQKPWAHRSHTLSQGESHTTLTIGDLRGSCNEAWPKPTSCRRVTSRFWLVLALALAAPSPSWP